MRIPRRSLEKWDTRVRFLFSFLFFSSREKTAPLGITERAKTFFFFRLSCFASDHIIEIFDKSHDLLFVAMSRFIYKIVIMKVSKIFTKIFIHFILHMFILLPNYFTSSSLEFFNESHARFFLIFCSNDRYNSIGETREKARKSVQFHRYTTYVQIQIFQQRSNFSFEIVLSITVFIHPRFHDSHNSNN